MTILAKPEIIAARERGDIMIEPYNPDHVKNSSVDVTLGEWYFLEKKSNKTNEIISLPSNCDDSFLYLDSSEVLNMYDEASVARMWGEPLKARELDHDLPGITKGSKIIVLHPGENALCHTEQFIGATSNNITHMMKARSSIGRSLILVCKCAGLGDHFFANSYVMEITNTGKRSVILVVGRRLAQIVFFYSTGINDEADAYYSSGKYQTQNLKGKSYKELQELWHPDMMLPKMWKDKETEVKK